MNQSLVSLKPHNTFGVEAWARSCHVINCIEEAQQQLNESGLPDLILSGGSNVLLARPIIERVWINRISGKTIQHQNNGKALVYLGAGEPWDDAVAWTLDQNAYGLENLSLIPGCCGAAPIQNIGAYGVEIAQWMHRVGVLNLTTAEHLWFTNDECDFSYRHSRFRNVDHFPFLITGIELNLSSKPKVNCNYPALAEELQHANINSITPQQIRTAVTAIRRRKLPDPSELGNAGSFFKNPIIDTTMLKALPQKYSDLPRWEMPDQRVKISAAWLIDQCGFKGHRQGDAAVHDKHALVIVNHGNASGQELLSLSELIQSTVHEKTGVWLEPEPTIIR